LTSRAKRAGIRAGDARARAGIGGIVHTVNGDGVGAAERGDFAADGVPAHAPAEHADTGRGVAPDAVAVRCIT
jgi:hypothetical protein